MTASQSIELSHEPLAASQLTQEQKQRLTEILDRYLASLETAAPMCPESLVARHPDLAAPLKIYLGSLEELHDAAAGFGRGDRPDSAEHDEPESDLRRLGDFILGRELGRGGMGIVYEARQISLDRTVALKILPFAAVLNSKQIARFKSEAQAAAQILHPNIVPVFAIGVERGVHYYAMQFIDGQPLDLAISELRERKRAVGRDATRPPHSHAVDIKAPHAQGQHLCCSGKRSSDAVQSSLPASRPASESPLSSTCGHAAAYFRAVAGLGIQASEALHAAHEFGVIHRDIKPSNLLLEPDGKLWVTDFGLARCQREATLSRTGDIIGTMRYMSPEQASGQSALIDQRTDVYSLGATLYELLTLEPAISGEEGPALLRHIDQQGPVPLRKLQPKIPADLENVILKAMSKSREGRYTTAREFADDLRRFLDGRSTVARPATVAECATKWAIRHHRLVAAAAVFMLLAGVGFAASTLLIAREKLVSDRNFQRAEQNFRDAQEAVDRFGAEFAERLASIPGAGSVRREILQDTLAYYQRFVDQAADNPALQADLGLTYSKIGTLAGEIGSSDEAILAHQRALAVFTALVASEPREWEHSRRLALCRNNLGMMLRRAGRVDEAEQSYRAAIELQQSVLRRTGDERVASDLAVSYTNLGLLWSETGDQRQAEHGFREALNLQQRLVAAAPEDARLHRNLALTFNNLSTLYVRSHDVQAADCYESALRHQQQALAAAPNNTTYTSELAATYNNLGALQARQHNYAAASASYDHAIRLQRELLQADPSRKAYRQELAVSLNNLGLLQGRLRNASAADVAFQQSIAIQEPLLALYPDDLVLRSGLGGVYNNLGIALEEQRRFADAATAYLHAVDQQRVAYSRASSVVQYRMFLSKHYFNYGRVLRQLGQPDRAAQVAISRRQLWSGDGERLFSVAEELALASQDLQRMPERRELTAEQVAALAVETLEQAVAAGLLWPSGLESSATFSALLGNERFLQLVSH